MKLSEYTIVLIALSLSACSQQAQVAQRPRLPGATMAVSPLDELDALVRTLNNEPWMRFAGYHSQGRMPSATVRMADGQPYLHVANVSTEDGQDAVIEWVQERLDDTSVSDIVIEFRGHAIQHGAISTADYRITRSYRVRVRAQ